MWLIEFSDKLRKDTHFIFEIFSLSISCTKRQACEYCKIFKRIFAENYKIAHLLQIAQLHICLVIHSFIHSGHFYSAPSSPLLLRGAPDYSTDTVSEFHAEAHRQLQVKLPKVPTWRLERESNPRPSG